MSKKRIVVGISGATGAIYGVSLLEYLRQLPEIEIHLIVSRWAEETIKLETGCTPQQVHSLADAWYPADALDAAVSSGSFTTGGMIILPCSMKTLSAIASGYTGELLSRAADVTIKEGRTLVLCPRETAKCDPPGKYAQAEPYRGKNSPSHAQLLPKPHNHRRPGALSGGTGFRSTEYPH